MFIRCLELQYRAGESVYEKSGSVNTLTPELNSDPRLEEKSSCHIEEVMVFPLYHRVLFRPLDTRKLMENPMSIKQLSDSQFSSIIRPDLFHTVTKLGSNHSDKSN